MIFGIDSRLNESMSNAIKKAKIRVEKAYGMRVSDRKWLQTIPIDSYSDPCYRIEIYVLEGSPCKGYVIADYGRRYVRPINAWGKPLKLIEIIE